jgi:hypothetical protein
MSTNSPFTQIPAELQAVFEELRQFEPIFHTAEFGSTAEDFEDRMSPEYWEVGASGRRYSRAFILQEAGKIAHIDASHAGWQISEYGLRQFDPGIFLLTYTLNQNGRLTRRASIWQKHEGSWQILYHQGTIVTSDEDDTLPA